MPERVLPPKLVESLRRAPGILDLTLGLMKNIDPRDFGKKSFANPRRRVPGEDTTQVGMRVRKLALREELAGIGAVVLKRVHWPAERPAKNEINRIHKAVNRHNHLFAPRYYSVMHPHAYAISHDIVAMSETDAPPLAFLRNGRYLTPRGRLLTQELEEADPASGKPRKEAFWQAAKLLSDRTGIPERNWLYLGMKDGKFVFMPLIDIE